MALKQEIGLISACGIIVGEWHFGWDGMEPHPRCSEGDNKAIPSCWSHPRISPPPQISAWEAEVLKGCTCFARRASLIQSPAISSLKGSWIAGDVKDPGKLLSDGIRY